MIEVKNTTIIGLLAVGLAIGLTGISGAALAEPAQPDEPATIETTAEPDVVDYERCELVIHDPFGMPQVLPYPCNVSINQPDVSTTASEPDVICWKAGEDPMGMPVLYPYPCLK